MLKKIIKDHPCFLPVATEELGQYDEAEDDPGDEEVDVEHPAEKEEVR